MKALRMTTLSRGSDGCCSSSVQTSTFRKGKAKKDGKAQTFKHGAFTVYYLLVCNFLLLVGGRWYKFNIEMTRFRQFETSSMAQLIQTLRETPPGPKFQYQDHPIMVNAECPWHLYQGALDVDSMLYSNLEDMGRHFDLILLQKDYEFDPRLLRPVNKPFATPKRFCRTPRMSTTKSTVSRNLRASLERANVFNTAMHATPIMARSASNASFTRTPGGSRGGPQLAEFQQRFLQFMSTEPARQQALSASLTIPQAVLATLRHHVNGLCERMAEKLRRKCPNPAGDRWRDTMTLYYHIMLEITGSYLQRTKDFQILNDKPFIRSLVFIVFEIVRFTWKLGTKGMTDELLRQINPDCISLIAMLDIVNSTAFWFSDWVRKRLVELQERMMETQVWREPVFYRMLSVLAGASAYAHAHQSGDYGPLIPILTLYQHHCGAGSLEPMGSNPEMAGISGIVGRTQSMIQGRLKQLCDDLRTPESTYSTALKLVQWGLEREHEHRYLNNRHVDVYAICCLYGAAVVQKRPMKFKTIVEMYRRQPQFLDKTLTEIYLGPSETGDLTVYYNTVFLSTMRGFMSLSEGDTGIPGNNYALHALTQPAHINSSAHVAVDIHPVRMPQPPAPSTPTSAAATAHFIPSTPRTPTRTAQLRAAAMDMTPRTRRYSATETPLTPRNMSPGTPNGSSRRLFGGAVGGMAGLPPRIPSARKPSRSDKHQQ
ncbi:uncharacterized protein EV422DRAFT_355054 [Fimicolochytrium jonesii]|uniref:uncharacterized protein n=1 Tax=Fimicolochytrium jonesii TaxID=1396493 RepID=UPI0022FE6E97|nr:uncharacterized protein EV422DRAFT_355054 [Fimicolochytrium jonesii]KAI8823437.1 hypothetical protein EV422DRAFT_355054 [Fimicolochytrium jonesii]